MKTVIIGGATGIGFAIAKKLVQEGHQVVLAGRTKEALEKAMRQLGKSASIKVLDITEFDRLPVFFQEIGPFDHLVVTSTQTTFQLLTELSVEKIFSMVNTKLLGSLFAAKAAISHLNPQGSITFFAGIIGQKALKGGSVVALINSGLEGLARTLALEFAPVRINVIAPGTVDTGKWDALAAPEKQQAKSAAGVGLPVQRVGEADDLAEGALFAIKNTFLTGATLRIDGGGSL
jgi:NAD(P)-dependent dehydrogenase (short-subunit alcohol dehydrogenase family)